MKLDGHVYRRERKNMHIFLVGKPEGEPSARPRHRWLDTNAMCHTEIEWQDVDWVYLAEDIDKWQALVNIVMNFQVS